MKSSVLVSRIVRVVETDGGIGEGAELADAYAEAVRAVNRRLEGVQAALDAKQGSDAVRLLEAEPRLLDEAGTLDFFQLPEWQALCSRSGWPVPDRVDQVLLERVLEIAGSATMVEPALKMYRRAMRTKDEGLLLQSLRSLAAADKSSDWRKELRQIEGTVQRRLLTDFRKAKEAGDELGMAQAADSLLDEKWSAPPEESILREPSVFRREKEEARRRKEQAEDIELLKQISGDWKRERAESLLRHLDALAMSGLAMPAAAGDLIASIRARCEQEAAEAEAEERWRGAIEQLHVAVAHGDPDEIRTSLASPEFLDRPPDEELQARAEMAVAQAEDARRRKLRLLASCLVLVLAGILILAGKVYTQRRFDSLCVSEAKRLAQIAGAPRAHEALKNALGTLEKENPKVRRDPRIKAFETRLAEIETARNARLAEADRLFAKLDEENSANWPGTEDESMATLKRLHELILPEDEEPAKRLATLELAFHQTWTARHSDRRAQGERNLETVLATIDASSKACRTEFPSPSRIAAVAKSKDSAERWRASYANEAPALVPRLDDALRELDATVKRMNEAGETTNELSRAEDIAAFLRARESLRTGFASFRGVSSLVPLSVSEEDFTRLLNGDLPGQRRVRRSSDRSDQEERFRTVLEDAKDFRNLDSWYSLYGIGDSKGVLAYHVNRPQISNEKTSTGLTKATISGRGLLDARTLQIVDTIQVSLRASDRLEAQLTPISSELRDLVDFAARGTTDRVRFSHWLQARLKALLRDAKGNASPPVSVPTGSGSRTMTYLEQEMADEHYLRHGRFPAYGRVQIMDQYLEWLERMGDLPENLPGPSGWRLRFSDLATSVGVDGVEDAMIWACLGEPRVRSRNRQCAEFLDRLPSDLFDQIQSGRDFDDRIEEVSFWKAAFAGSFAFRPDRSDVIIPRLLPSVKADHPLYVLRYVGDNLILRKALEPSRKSPGAWALAPGAKELAKQAEPLFEVRRDGKAFDPESVVAALLKTAPKGSEKAFAKNSFWIEIPMKNSEKSEQR